MLKILVLAGLIAVPATSCAATAASGVPAATLSASTYDSSYDRSTRLIREKVPGQIGSGSVSADVEDATTPFISLNSALAGTDYNQSATATLDYYFQITGSGADVVTLHAYARLVTTAQNGAADQDASANLSISNPTSSNGAGLRGNQTFADILTFTAHPGDVTKVELTASVGLQCCDAPIGSSASAYVDPYIYIDADDLARNPTLGLSFSNGIGDADPRIVSDTPEPASWAMLICGFGLIGWRLRRCRPARRAATAPGSMRNGMS